VGYSSNPASAGKLPVHTNGGVTINKCVTFFVSHPDYPTWDTVRIPHQQGNYQFTLMVVWRFLLTTLYLHFPLSLTRLLCSSPTFKPRGLCLVKQFLPCPLGVHNHRPLSNFLLGRCFGNLNCSWAASALWLLKSRTGVLFHFWYVLLFLICIIILGIYFVFDFHCSYWHTGQFSWAMHTQSGTYLHMYACKYFCMLYYFSWGMRILIDTYLFSCYTIVDVWLRCTSVNVQGILRL
jgi:hypothetical protein